MCEWVCVLGCFKTRECNSRAAAAVTGVCGTPISVLVLNQGGRMLPCRLSVHADMPCFWTSY